jgi:hypothetical protein
VLSRAAAAASPSLCGAGSLASLCGAASSSSLCGAETPSLCGAASLASLCGGAVADTMRSCGGSQGRRNVVLGPDAAAAATTATVMPKSLLVN